LDTREYIINKINNIQLNEEDAPFPFFFIDDLLPSEKFEKLKYQSEEYVLSVSSKIYHGNRKMIINTSKDFDVLLSMSPDWKELYEVLNSKEFFNALCGKFSTLKNKELDLQDIYTRSKNPTLARIQRTGELSVKEASLHKILVYKLYDFLKYAKEKFHIFSLEFLQKRKIVQLLFDLSHAGKEYSREIHRDSDNRLIVFLYYMSELPVEEKGGSLELYKIKEQSQSWKNKEPRPREDDCEKFESIAPVGNRLVVFLNTENSFHGVEKMTCSSSSRLFCYGAYTLMSKPLYSFQKHLKTEFTLYR
jgi:hypothetical protein